MWHFTCSQFTIPGYCFPLLLPVASIIPGLPEEGRLSLAPPWQSQVSRTKPRCCVFFLPTERNCRLGEKAVRTDGKSVPDTVFAHVREHRLRVYEDQDLWKFRVAHHLPSPHV